KFIEIFLVTNELMQMTLRAYQLELQVNANPDSFDKARSLLVNRIKNIHKNYDIEVDRGVFENVMPLYTDNVNTSIYGKSAFVNEDTALKLLEGGRKQVLKKLKADPAYIYASPMIKKLYETLNPAFEKESIAIAAVQKQYMKALMEALPEARYFPDANSTLRVTYGKVRGYAPRDAVYYNPVSYLDGVIEKYVPGDYEFDVPQKLRDLYESKDYGQYADATGKVPVCFLGTNHTTGGNSGSPAIDAYGNLVGLNFDRVWEGTMSDMNYDPEICRNIMVDLRYVLFIIDKFAGATHLIDEMQLVHPKRSGN
ncbi:MAG: S46 family peptidase, partial [Bacteroidota bacterium]